MARNKDISGIYDGLKGKLLLWLRALLDETNPESYMNQTGAARVAGYKCATDGCFRSIGAQNYTKLSDRIEKWLDEEGLSEKRLKTKLLSLIESKQVVFHKIKGKVKQKVKQEDLPPGVVILAEAQIMKWAGHGEESEAYDDGDTLVAISVEALETQRRSLDMALKIKGSYAKDNEQKKPEVVLAADISPEKQAALNSAYQSALKELKK